jgi:hypothetical protein
VPSTSLHTWRGPRAAKLDEIESAHHAVSGTSPGRRRATEQVNHAYTVLLSSQFQGFCRDLHSECIGALKCTISNQPMAELVRVEFLFARRLDRGNPTPANIGADFERLGVELWQQLRRVDVRSISRVRRLEQLAGWRNAIAHQDFERGALVPDRVQLRTVRGWRRTCNALALGFDRVMNGYLASVTGSKPW